MSPSDENGKVAVEAGDPLISLAGLPRKRIDAEVGNDHPQTVQSMNNLAHTLMEEGRYPEAEILLRHLIDVESRPRQVGNHGARPLYLWSQSSL